jgi:hypothetical protein
VVTDLSIHEEADDRRLLMRHTLAALIDVVPPALAAESRCRTHPFSAQPFHP